MPTSDQLEAIRTLYARADRALRRGENKAAADVLAALSRAEGELTGRLLPLYWSDGMTLAQWQNSGRLTSLLNAVHRTLMDFAQGATNSTYSDAVAQFMASYDQHSYLLDKITPDEIDPHYAPPDVNSLNLLINTEYKGAMFSQRYGLISDAMASDIRDELAQSIIQGESVSQAAQRVRGVLGEEGSGYYHRAETIARTEMMRTKNMARDLVYDQSRDVLEDEDQWLTSDDEKTCEWCNRRDEKTDAEIQAEDSGDDPFGDQTEQPLHPNCRCTKIPRVKAWQDVVGLDMPEEADTTTRGYRSASGDWRIDTLDTFDDWSAE